MRYSTTPLSSLRPIRGLSLPERPYSMSLAYAARLKCDARPATRPGCGSLLDRLTSIPDKEDAQRQWTSRTRCLEVAKWPRGYSGELIFHRRLLQSPPTDFTHQMCRAPSSETRHSRSSPDAARHRRNSLNSVGGDCNNRRWEMSSPEYPLGHLATSRHLAQPVHCLCA